MIDTHCHLNMLPLASNLAAVLAKARSRGVSQVIIPAYDQSSWAEITNLADLPGLHAALGIHPWVADTIEAEQLSVQLITAVKKSAPKVVAIGEIGLDTKIESPGLAIQLQIFKTQLELAVELDLPVILHCRGAFHELLDAINHHQGKIRGVIHAFSRGPELVKRFHDAGLYFGLGGAVTRDNARRVHKGARVIPENRLLLETDAPSIGLQGISPEETEPQHVVDVAAALASIREVEPEQIARATTENACLLFGLPS